jgi:hypothetical protein
VGRGTRVLLLGEIEMTGVVMIATIIGGGGGGGGLPDIRRILAGGIGGIIIVWPAHDDDE